MYEQPEWKEDKKFHTLDYNGFDGWFVYWFSNDKDLFDKLKSRFEVWGSDELAQHAADKRNAELKLLRLAQEREKEYHIDLDDENQCVFSFDFYINTEYFFEPVESKVKYIRSNRLYVAGFNSTSEVKSWLKFNFTPSEIESLCRPMRYC